MSLHQAEFGSIVERLNESALDATARQVEEAERMVSERFPSLDANGRTQMVAALLHALAINYLAAATVRNLPKS